jgi:predicted nucleotidyltransferase
MINLEKNRPGFASRIVAKNKPLKHGNNAIVLFGSLARKDQRLRLDFDIDLALSCSPEKYYSLVSLMLDVRNLRWICSILKRRKGY